MNPEERPTPAGAPRGKETRRRGVLFFDSWLEPFWQGNPVALSGLLVAVVAAAYLPVLQNGFVNFDDPGYIYANTYVQRGLTWEGVRWAFKSLYGGFWHPLTWLSILLDAELFGAHAGGHHLTSALLHAASTVLLFLVFRRMTGATWRSAVVAGLFGVHPLHVESVAWASERKDVLSAFFWMLTMCAYVRYARPLNYGPGSTLPRSTLPRSYGWYVLALVFFACGLMSKTMLVTLPLVLLLMDFWPLRRLDGGEKEPTRWVQLVVEKVPFLVLALGAGLVTVVAQHQSRAVQAVDRFPIFARAANAIQSYGVYLVQMVWPADLVAFYPYPKSFHFWAVGGLAIVGGLVTVAAVLSARKRPYLAFGWIWYVVTLAPVIGLIQVGSQAHADRYTYIPLIGIFVMLSWGLYELAGGLRVPAPVLGSATAAVVVACVGLTRHQIGYWSDSVVLFRHTLSVTPNNEIAHNNLGTTLFRRGRTDEALVQFREAVRLAPKYALARANLGSALIVKGQLDEAIAQLQEAVRLDPEHAGAYRNLGVALGTKGRVNEAMAALQQAIKLAPGDAEAYFNLGVAFGSQGRLDEAIAAYEQALRFRAGYRDAEINLKAMLDLKAARAKQGPAQVKPK